MEGGVTPPSDLFEATRAYGRKILDRRSVLSIRE